MNQVIVNNRGIGIRRPSLLDRLVDLLAKIGTYAAPGIEDEAAMYFCLSLDCMDW